MISKGLSRFIKQLQVKKYRLAEQSFIVQGAKAVQETLLSSFEVTILAATPQFLSSLAPELLRRAKEVFEVTESELSSLGSVESNAAALAVVKMKKAVPASLGPQEYGLILDDIRDPGNLGTIIRTADWYGIRQVVASPETADCYNPKVISATMGSFLRVNFNYEPLVEFVAQHKLPFLGAFLDGADVHAFRFPPSGWIVVGNESRGISEELSKHITQRITIPRYGQAESLNASVATAIILDNLRR
ncbi:MAG TPA: RNA methyltransferase [Cyclobacteriaceae bacterium]|nr:RNA methyltransferase [Cyclobacteriaceae bacterium]